jgi:transposase-like protein
MGRAQAEGLQLTGEGGLLQQLTKRLPESALEGEITDHLGYDKHDRRAPEAATAATVSAPKRC